MKLYVNEKLFSMHKKFYIKDENNFDVYEISSKFISIGDKYEIVINDIEKKEIALAIIVAITNNVNRRQH